MKIALIYNKTNSTVLGPGDYFERIFKAHKIDYSHYPLSANTNIPTTYDLYFRVDHGDYKDVLPRTLKPSVFYAIDTHLKKPFKKIRQQAQDFNIIFCAQKTALDELKKIKGVDAQWAPLGCDPDIHQIINTPKKYDLAFIGRDAQKFDRGRHLKLLKANFPNIYIGDSPSSGISQIYASAKIGFNSSISNDINMRIFEVMASGCFLLTNRIKNNGFDILFKDGRDLVTYTTDKDLLEKISYYLSHDDERERIARTGAELIRTRLTYFHTLQRIFNYIAFKFGGKYNSLRI